MSDMNTTYSQNLFLAEEFSLKTKNINKSKYY